MEWVLKAISSAILAVILCDKYDGVLYLIMFFLAYFSILILFNVHKDIFK